jgi:hypothetical protein
MDVQRNISIDNKINNLPLAERKKFNESFIGVLEFRDLSYMFGIKGEDFIDPPEEQRILAKEKLYNQMYEQNI